MFTVGLLRLLICCSLLPGLFRPAAAFDLNDLNRDRGNFFLGFFTGYAAHELGHLLIADSLGYESEFDGVTIVYPDADLEGQDLVRIASAGFQAQWLASEIAFHYRAGNDLSMAADNFSAGVVASHIAISAAYLSVLMHHKDGDIEGLSKGTGISRQQLALTLALPAVLDSWRLLDDDPPSWVPTVSAGSKALGLTWIWTFD